jgi:hypothetical protein
MCEGAIPGKELPTVKNCPSCGADLSRLVRQRLAALAPKDPPPQPTSFTTHAAFVSLVLPCVGIVVKLIGAAALGESPVGMLVLGIVCWVLFAGGLTLAVIAFSAPKGAGPGTIGKALAGICINGLLILFTILSVLTRQKVSATENESPAPPRKAWSYISGK